MKFVFLNNFLAMAPCTQTAKGQMSLAYIYVDGVPRHTSVGNLFNRTTGPWHIHECRRSFVAFGKKKVSIPSVPWHWCACRVLSHWHILITWHYMVDSKRVKVYK
jgi:hypothetical protein